MAAFSVLLVEDNPLLARIAIRFITNQDPEHLAFAGWAQSAEEALELARASRPEVFVVDQMVRESSGGEFFPRLRSLYPNVGLIVLSPHALETDREAALAAGADALVAKARMGTDLIPAVLRVMEARRQGPTKN